MHRDIADVPQATLVEAIGSLVVAPSEDPASQVGPLIDVASAARIDSTVEDPAAYGTMLVRGGIADETRVGGANYQ